VGITQRVEVEILRGKLPGQLRDRTPRFITTDLNRFQDVTNPGVDAFVTFAILFEENFDSGYVVAVFPK
jgi:hypothetical protein